ncbi:MAG: tRNA pseudouridine(13) synthase TruD [Candidatus Woesearchaeota archaeon]
MYQIKQIPEDFIVEEINDIRLEEKGEFSIFLLKKINLTTEKAVSIVADRLNIPRRFFHYSGTKDRNAITSQFISAKSNKTNNIKENNLSLEFKGFSDSPTSLGTHQGNRFKITVRNIDDKPSPIRFFPNLFGEQRFSKNNVEIGRMIVKKQFKEAVNIILQNQGDYEIMIQGFIEKAPNDYIGALRTIPKRILSIFVHSYQSDLWNTAVEEFIKVNHLKDLKGKKLEEYKDKKISILGFGSEKNDIYEKIMEKEDIKPRDFIIRAIPEISAEGGERFIMTEIINLKISDLHDDELNKGKKKCILNFELGKGSYATEAVRFLCQPR